MLGIIIAICTLASFILGFLVYLLLWGRDTKLEKYFYKAKDELINLKYLPELEEVKRTIIIVDSGAGISPVRTFLKKIWATITGKHIGSVIFVFNKHTEEEQKAYLIQQAIGVNFRSIELLDADFIETMINYYSYKFATQQKIEQNVSYILRRDFENTKFRDWLPFLDDVKFSGSVVINPPPLEKPVMFNLLLPMVQEKSAELITNRAPILEKEQSKKTFMQLAESLYRRECGILFVGDLTTEDYFKMMVENKDRFSCFVVAARGSLIDKLENLRNKISERCKSQMNKQFELITVRGKWEFEDGKVDCRWIICIPREDPHKQCLI